MASSRKKHIQGESGPPNQRDDAPGLEVPAALRAELEALRARNRELAEAEADLLRAEAALVDERNLLRTLVDNLPDYIFAKDGESRFVLNNTAHLHLLRARRQEDVLGKTDFDFFPQDLAERYFADEQAIARSGEALVNREEEVLDEHGEKQWVLTTKVPLRGGHGKIVGIVGVSRNVTQRKKHDEELRFRKALLESQNEASLDGILVVGPEGDMLSFNQRFVQMWRIPQEVIRSGSDEAALASVVDKLENPGEFQEKVRYLYEHPDEESRDEIRLRDGRVLDRFSAPVKGPGGESYGRLWIFRDMTERERMKKVLEHHAELLERANRDLHQRNQELDDFAYVASHDLQEPLRKLIAFGSALEEDMARGEQDEALEDARVLASAARRMQQLVQDLLALSRSSRQNMKLEHVALDACVDRALIALEARIDETGAVIVREELPAVRGDARLLAQLYQNLIGNALKFHGDAPPRVTLSAARAEAGWQLTVADEGIGINPDYTEQIFTPFKRLHGRERYEGTGIGLAICRKIVERHGGRIWVDSREGEGARFHFTIAERETA